jgi:hypothetical protein
VDKQKLEEQHEILCPKDVREGKDSDRFLAPAISRFVSPR